MAGPLRVLFLGNSYTYYNDLPGLVRAFGAAAGLPIETAACVQGGMSLQGQLGGGRALELIRGASWDAVVLQDQSLRPVRAPALTRRAALALHAEVARAGARTVLYLTWARQKEPAQQALLDHAYYSIARECGAEVAPAGPAWLRALAELPGTDLYRPDGAHPAPPGSYLAAAVLFGRLTGRSPAGLPVRTVQAGGDGPSTPVELPAAGVAALQRIAAEALAAAPAPAAWPRHPRLDAALEADPDLALLQEVPLLCDLDAADIAALLSVSPPRRVPAGTRLCAAGEAEAAAYVVLEGQVVERARQGEILHDPRHLGLALTVGRESLAGRAYASTVTAATEALVLPIRRADLAELAGRSPAAADRLRANMA